MPDGLDFASSALAGVALFPAPVPDMARALGSEIQAGLVPTLVETLRRSRLPEYLDGDGAQRELSVDERQLRYLRETRRLPFIKRGRLIRYRTADLFAWMEEARVEAKGET